MITQDRLDLTRILELQTHDYWQEVDFNWGREAHLYYTEDAVFEGSFGTFYTGRDQIKDFYAYRVSRGARTAVHSVSNFRAEMTGADTATSTWYMQLFAQDGTPPHPSAPPIVLAAMVDKHQLQADGAWLCCHRQFNTLFKGGVPVTVLPGAPKKGA